MKSSISCFLFRKSVTLVRKSFLGVGVSSCCQRLLIYYEIHEACLALESDFSVQSKT